MHMISKQLDEVAKYHTFEPTSPHYSLDRTFFLLAPVWTHALRVTTAKNIVIILLGNLHT